MKQLMMGFAACALLLTGCTEQDITERVIDGQGQLNFSTGIGKQATKTAELMNSTLQTQADGETTGIALRTYKAKEGTPKAFEKWFEDNLWYSDGEWKIKSTRFRNTVETKFITYFPKTYVSEVEGSFDGADFAATDGKFPAFTCTVAANSKEQKDLIAGITEVVPNQTDITIGLRHILSQVNFGTRGYSGAIISIQNIKIVGLYNSATYTYGAENKYPIGDWTKLKTGDAEERAASYEYYDYSNETKTDNPQPITPVDAKTGDVYVFGDGGNAGPGRAVTTWYPIGTKNAWGNAPVRDPISLDNSLMLMPQDFMTDAPNAKVTFEYQIMDVDSAYVAGGPNGVWAKGEFKLDFKTGDDPTVDKPENKYYLGKWEQNFRYLYLIDFTDFLDGSALTFTVDVEAYPWENYNNDGGDDGIINIMAAGQPTPANMNKIEKDGTWYIASQSETDPTTIDPIKWAQVIRDEVWNLSTYDFTKIEVLETFNLNFRNVIFNTKNTPSDPTAITFTLPEGFEAVKATSVDNGQITLDGNAPTYTIKSGDRSAAAAITITNVNYYRTSEKLKEGIEGAGTNKQSFVYGGTKAVNLTEMEPTGLTVDNTITVKFTREVIPTVGATTNGIWTWNATTKIATWTKVTWKAIDAAKTDFKAAAANAVIYCSEATVIDLSTTFGEPTTTANSPVHVVFNKAADRTGSGTTNGVWTYSSASKTATWTKNPPDPQP